MKLWNYGDFGGLCDYGNMVFITIMVIMKLWNYGNYADYGIMGLWNYGVMAWCDYDVLVLWYIIISCDYVFMETSGDVVYYEIMALRNSTNLGIKTAVNLKDWQ